VEGGGRWGGGGGGILSNSIIAIPFTIYIATCMLCKNNNGYVKMEDTSTVRVGLACQIGPGDLVMSGPQYRSFGKNLKAQPQRSFEM